MREKSCLPRSVFFTFIFVIHNLHKESRDHLFSFKNLDDATDRCTRKDANLGWLKIMSAAMNNLIIIDNIYFKLSRIWFQSFIVWSTLQFASTKKLELINCSLISSYNYNWSHSLDKNMSQYCISTLIYEYINLLIMKEEGFKVSSFNRTDISCSTILNIQNTGFGLLMCLMSEQDLVDLKEVTRGFCFHVN